MFPITAIATLAAATIGLAATPASAVHYNRGAFVQAFQPCDSPAANAQTAAGIQACAPAAPSSDCATHPDTALRLQQDARTAFTYRNTGRRETRANGSVVDIFATVALSGIETCSGEPYDGSLDIEVQLQMFREDSACATGSCVLPDFSYRHRIECAGGACRLRADSANQALIAQGLPPLPSDMPFSLRLLRFAVLDLAGRPLLTNGLTVAADSTEIVAQRKGWRAWFSGPSGQAALEAALAWVMPERAEAYVGTTPSRSKRLLTRSVQAYPTCTLETADTFTRDGLPACSAVPRSSCQTDPDHAVTVEVPEKHRTREGREKFEYRLQGDVLEIDGGLHGLYDCLGEPYDGPLLFKTFVRATLDDPVCGGGGCTSVDTSWVQVVVNVVGGEALIESKFRLGSAGSFAGVGGTINVEVTEMQFLDQSGNAVLAGPATQVRCNPDDGDGLFCYSN